MHAFYILYMVEEVFLLHIHTVITMVVTLSSLLPFVHSHRVFVVVVEVIVVAFVISGGGGVVALFCILHQKLRCLFRIDSLGTATNVHITAQYMHAFALSFKHIRIYICTLHNIAAVVIIIVVAVAADTATAAADTAASVTFVVDVVVVNGVYGLRCIHYVRVCVCVSAVSRCV